MSTFLVTLTVVVLATVAAVAVAIRDPDQPAMLRSTPWRDRWREWRANRPPRPPKPPGPPRALRTRLAPEREVRVPAEQVASAPAVPEPVGAVRERVEPIAERVGVGAGPAPAPAPTAGGAELAERAVTASSDQWVAVPRGPSVWVRLRSGVVLTVLLAIMGALLAAGISGLILLIAFAVREAVS